MDPRRHTDLRRGKHLSQRDESDTGRRDGGARKSLHRGVLHHIGRAGRKLGQFFQRTFAKPCLNLLGRLHVRRGRFEEAEACFRRALEIDPMNFTARLQLGRVYFLMQEFFRAEQQFLKAQEVDPKRFHKNRLPEDYTCWDVIERQEIDSIFGEYENEGSIYSFGDGSYPEGSTFAEGSDPLRERPFSDTPFSDSAFADSESSQSDTSFSGSIFSDPVFSESGYLDSGCDAEFEESSADDAFGEAQAADAFAADSLSEARFEESEAAGVDDAGLDPEPIRYGAKSRFQGDFSSFAEWKRFQSLPPISPTELESVDWDQIIASL